jgi:hypothetical protein
LLVVLYIYSWFSAFFSNFIYIYTPLYITHSTLYHFSLRLPFVTVPSESLTAVYSQLGQVCFLFSSAHTPPRTLDVATCIFLLPLRFRCFSLRHHRTAPSVSAPAFIRSLALPFSRLLSFADIVVSPVFLLWFSFSFTMLPLSHSNRFSILHFVLSFTAAATSDSTFLVTLA